MPRLAIADYTLRNNVPIEITGEGLARDQIEKLKAWLGKPEKKVLEAIVASRVRALTFNALDEIFRSTGEADPASVLASSEMKEARRYASFLDILKWIETTDSFTMTKWK